MASSRSPYAGGALNPSANPTAVDGSVALFGARSTPPDLAIPQQALARNNRGTNVTIPYARLVRSALSKYHICATRFLLPHMVAD